MAELIHTHTSRFRPGKVATGVILAGAAEVDTAPTTVGYPGWEETVVSEEAVAVGVMTQVVVGQAELAVSEEAEAGATGAAVEQVQALAAAARVVLEEEEEARLLVARYLSGRAPA